MRNCKFYRVENKTYFFLSFKYLGNRYDEDYNSRGDHQRNYSEGRGGGSSGAGNSRSGNRGGYIDKRAGPRRTDGRPRSDYNNRDSAHRDEQYANNHRGSRDISSRGKCSEIAKS